jgi:hypothetical protein
MEAAMTLKSLAIGTAVALVLGAAAWGYGSSANAQPYGGWGMMGGYGQGYMHGPGMMGDYGPGYGPGWMHGNRGYDRDDRPGYGPRYGRGFMHREYGSDAPRSYQPNSN